jgi:hypothetical protein
MAETKILKFKSLEEIPDNYVVDSETVAVWKAQLLKQVEASAEDMNKSNVVQVSSSYKNGKVIVRVKYKNGVVERRVVERPLKIEEIKKVGSPEDVFKDKDDIVNK